MIRVLLPKFMADFDLPMILEKINIEYYANEADYEKKIMEDFWHIIYGPVNEKQRSAIFVNNTDSLYFAIKYIETKNKLDDCQRVCGVLDRHVELQGIKIIETLKDLKRLQNEKPDCFVIVAEKGIEIEAYVDYFAKSYYSRVDEHLYEAIIDGKKVEIIVSTEYLHGHLNVVIPPLRKRKEDIPYMVDKALSSIHQRYKRITVELPDEHTMKLLMSYTWPGNTEEFMKVMYKYAAGQDIVSHLKNSVAVEDIEPTRMRDYVNNIVVEIEKQLILSALEKTSWNRKKAATMLGLNYKTLSHKIKKYGINKRQI